VPNSADDGNEPQLNLYQQPDGTLQICFSVAADAPIPHIDINADMGNFVYAVSQMPPGKSYMAEGQTCSWTEFCSIWSTVTGRKASYVAVTREQMIAALPDQAFAEELDEMFAYSTDPGYDGGDESLLKAEDIRKVGHCAVKACDGC
jgi:hypothetical protein